MQKNPYLPGTPDEFIEKNIGLAHMVAWRIIKSPSFKSICDLDNDDVISFAYFGLINAYKKFNPEGYTGENGGEIKFSIYAVPTIEGYIRREIRDRGRIIRIGREALEGLAIIRENGLTGFEPTEEIASKANLTLYKAKNITRAAKIQVLDSLDRPAFNGETDLSVSFGDTIASVNEADEKVIIMDFINRLNKRMRRLYHLRFRAGFTQAETGKIMGLSQVQVSRLERNLLAIAERYQHGEDGCEREAL